WDQTQEQPCSHDETVKEQRHDEWDESAYQLEWTRRLDRPTVVEIQTSPEESESDASQHAEDHKSHEGFAGRARELPGKNRENNSNGADQGQGTKILERLVPTQPQSSLHGDGWLIGTIGRGAHDCLPARGASYRSPSALHVSYRRVAGHGREGPDHFAGSAGELTQTNSSYS